MTPAVQPKELTGWPKAIVDFGPVMIFFAAHWYFSKPGAYNPIGGKPIIAATAVFVAALFLAMAYCWQKTRHLPPMLLLTGAVVGIFGGLTIWLKDDLFIKLRPTIANSLLGLLLFGYHLMGRQPMKTLLGEALPPLTDKGWSLFTWAWILFFFFSAGLNEVLRRVLNDTAYVAYTSWGDILITFAFMFACAPIIIKYEDKTAVSSPRN